MRILLLTQIIPYPPNAGPRVKYLAQQGHDVTLVSFVRPEEEEFVPTVRALCRDVYTVPIHRYRFPSWTARLSSPFTLIYLFALVYTAIHVLTWTLVRYRLPIDALLVQFAALSLLLIVNRRHARSR